MARWWADQLGKAERHKLIYRLLKQIRLIGHVMVTCCSDQLVIRFICNAFTGRAQDSSFRAVDGLLRPSLFLLESSAAVVLLVLVILSAKDGAINVSECVS